MLKSMHFRLLSIFSLLPGQNSSHVKTICHGASSEGGCSARARAYNSDKALEASNNSGNNLQGSAKDHSKLIVPLVSGKLSVWDTASNLEQRFEKYGALGGFQDHGWIV